MSKKTEKKKKNKEDISRKKDTSKNSKKNKQDSPTIEELLAIEKDKNLRLFAEFENFRKRTAREKLDLFSTANKDIISILLLKGLLIKKNIKLYRIINPNAALSPDL